MTAWSGGEPSAGLLHRGEPLSFDRGSEQVEDMMGQGMPFECVEDLVSALLSLRKERERWSRRRPICAIPLVHQSDCTLCGYVQLAGLRKDARDGYDRATLL